MPRNWSTYIACRINIIKHHAHNTHSKIGFLVLSSTIVWFTKYFVSIHFIYMNRYCSTKTFFLSILRRIILTFFLELLFFKAQQTLLHTRNLYNCFPLSKSYTLVLYFRSVIAFFMGNFFSQFL